MNARWRLGTEICLDCDYQGDWIDFIEEISPEKLAWIHSIADPILAPMKKAFDNPSSSAANLIAAIGETADRSAGKQPE